MLWASGRCATAAVPPPATSTCVVRLPQCAQCLPRSPFRAPWRGRCSPVRPPRIQEPAARPGLRCCTASVPVVCCVCADSTRTARVVACPAQRPPLGATITHPRTRSFLKAARIDPVRFMRSAPHAQQAAATAVVASIAGSALDRGPNVQTFAGPPPTTNQLTHQGRFALSRSGQSASLVKSRFPLFFPSRNRHWHATPAKSTIVSRLDSAARPRGQGHDGTNPRAEHSLVSAARPIVSHLPDKVSFATPSSTLHRPLSILHDRPSHKSLPVPASIPASTTRPFRRSLHTTAHAARVAVSNLFQTTILSSAEDEKPGTKHHSLPPTGITQPPTLVDRAAGFERIGTHLTATAARLLSLQARYYLIIILLALAS